MTTISEQHPVTFTLPANVVTTIDLSGYELDVPKGCRLGFKVSSDTRWRIDNSYVTPIKGMLAKPDGNLMSMETGWYKNNVMYFMPVNEAEVVVTFEVVIDWKLGGKQS